VPATLIPDSNLTARIGAADAIVVARTVNGVSLAAGDRVSNDFTLRIVASLKGSLIPGSEIGAHLEGRGMWILPEPRQTAILPLFGIWFLKACGSTYSVLSRDGKLGEIGFAPVVLPESAPRAALASVAQEIAASLRWLASAPVPRFGQLPLDFATLDPSETIPVYREFASEKIAALSTLGISGLIENNQPDGVKLAAAEWNTLTPEGRASIVGSLMSYSNDSDSDAVRSLDRLAVNDDPGLRRNVTQALRAIHTKEALPALAVLLDDKTPGVSFVAAQGFCLFVRNAPIVTPDAVRSMAWTGSRAPAPFRTPDTEPHCFPRSQTDPGAEAAFWKTWWAEHKAEIEAP
ncbi:MAG TPA: HEAT repeat domain-containing protein, partial [Bryobacteraceae bacterium]|nr:HEAT repeat domain-containing protein [Bryobacteraceae bacterium]